jgi:cytochrome c peroxidase
MAVAWMMFSISVYAEDTIYEPLPKMKHPADNPWSKDKEELGKMLYFDPRLSGRLVTILVWAGATDFLGR